MAIGSKKQTNCYVYMCETNEYGSVTLILLLKYEFFTMHGGCYPRNHSGPNYGCRLHNRMELFV